jgi:hypothetical protein
MVKAFLYRRRIWLFAESPRSTFPPPTKVFDLSDWALGALILIAKAFAGAAGVRLFEQDSKLKENALH